MGRLFMRLVYNLHYVAGESLRSPVDYFITSFQKTSKKSYPQKVLLEGTRMHQPLIRGENISVEGE